MSPQNPPWARDEIILALDLYRRRGPVWDESDSDVVALSQLLNSLGVHADVPDRAHFRSPNAVVLKLANLQHVDPDVSGGMSGASKADEATLFEFRVRDEELRALAAAIGAHAESGAIVPAAQAEEEFPEGRVLQRQHQQRERNERAVRKKKERALSESGRLVCEVCGFDFAEVYGPLGDGFIECHHEVPVSELQAGHRTKLEELALVCANCHRMLHRGRPWMSAQELREALAAEL